MYANGLITGATDVAMSVRGGGFPIVAAGAYICTVLLKLTVGLEFLDAVNRVYLLYVLNYSKRKARV